MKKRRTKSHEPHNLDGIPALVFGILFATVVAFFPFWSFTTQELWGPQSQVASAENTYTDTPTPTVQTTVLSISSPAVTQPVESEPDYLRLMIDCCLTGDLEGGTQAADARDKKIDQYHIDVVKIDFLDLYELARVIQNEAGADCFSHTWKCMVGEVVLNRVTSPEFPNTVHDVIFQDGQYAGVRTKRFQELLPNVQSTAAAISLLNGNRYIHDPSVVFQANRKQGSGVAVTLYDEIYGPTYLCYSSHPELYIKSGRG